MRRYWRGWRRCCQFSRYGYRRSANFLARDGNAMLLHNRVACLLADRVCRAAISSDLIV